MSFYLFNLTPSYLEGSPPPPSHFSEGEPPFNSPLHNPFHSFLGNGRDSPPQCLWDVFYPTVLGNHF
jgi:hypothetical protein